MTISEIIRTDDLHWNSEEKRFVALSEEELDKIISTCVLSGIDDDDKIEQMVRWAEKARTGQLLLEGIIDGRLGIRLDKDEPEFCAVIEQGKLEDF
jgi:hypothetical protein